MFGIKGKKGKGADVIELPPMRIEDYGKLPYDTVKLIRFRIRGLENLRAGSFLQYNLLLNPNVIAAFVDYGTKECFVVVNDKEDKESIAKKINSMPVYSGSDVLRYEADFEEEEEVSYADILKHRFNLEFVE